MNEHLSKLKESLSDWASIVQSNSEHRIAKAMFLSILNTSPIGGSFSGWLLAISGATIGLVFSNLESVLASLNPTDIRASLSFLFASCITGFIAKILGCYVELYRQLATELEPTIVSILEEHQTAQEKIEITAGELVEYPNLQPDFQRAMNQVLECVPKFFRKRGMSGFEKGKKDPLVIYKLATKIYFSQTIIVIFQVILFALFITVFIKSI